MDPRSIFEQLLSSGQELAAKGRDVAERGLGVPDSGDERSAMLSGLGKGAAAGGLDNRALCVGYDHVVDAN